MTEHEMTAEIQRLTLENAKLKAKKDQVRAGKLTLRVSPKGGVSVYGLGRYPITLYAETWLKLLAIVEEIKLFIEANRSLLKWKTEETEAA